MNIRIYTATGISFLANPPTNVGWILEIQNSTQWGSTLYYTVIFPCRLKVDYSGLFFAFHRQPTTSPGGILTEDIKAFIINSTDLLYILFSLVWETKQMSTYWREDIRWSCERKGTCRILKNIEEKWLLSGYGDILIIFLERLRDVSYK